MAEKKVSNANYGDQLVRQEVITREELDKAKAREEQSGIPWYRQMLQLRMINFGQFEKIMRFEIHLPGKGAPGESQSFGRTLVEMKAITEDQLRSALAEQKRSGRYLGNILLEQRMVTRSTIAIALSKQHGIEFAELSKTPSSSEALESVPEAVARNNHMIPVRIEGDRLSVLIADPQIRQTLSDVGVLLGKRIHPFLTICDDVTKEIAARYKNVKAADSSDARAKQGAPPAKGKGSRTVQQKGKTTKKEEATVSTQEEAIVEEKTTLRFEEIAKQASGAPVMKLVSTIIEGAANSGATDIHLDPQEPEMRVRYRIDGVLHDVMSIPRDTEAAVISRVKILADLDITETRHPQDGHISVGIGEAEYDIRVATLPTFLGERVVLRLLDQASVLAGIKDLGMEQDDEATLIRLIEQPYGMVLVTGPTGSGKTTTLYAALNQKNVMTESIVTLEDPVEYQLSGINQVQIDTDIKVTFASTLRAALRQDIDVLLVGEIRDPETAHIAVRAAMTGHLVFSTLHTNDSVEALSTLRNMGVPSYLLASALTAVLAQRLVRKICPKCKTGFTPDKGLLKSLGLPDSVKKLYRGTGCEYCYQTGHKGRTGIFEVLEITSDLRKMIAADDPTEKIAKLSKMKNMADRCRTKVKQGIISPEEFLNTIRI